MAIRTFVTFISTYLFNLQHKYLLEFLHCIPVGSKSGSDMPNMAVPDLNKI